MGGGGEGETLVVPLRAISRVLFISRGNEASSYKAEGELGPAVRIECFVKSLYAENTFVSSFFAL